MATTTDQTGETETTDGTDPGPLLVAGMFVGLGVAYLASALRMSGYGPTGPLLPDQAPYPFLSDAQMFAFAGLVALVGGIMLYTAETRASFE